MARSLRRRGLRVAHGVACALLWSLATAAHAGTDQCTGLAPAGAVAAAGRAFPQFRAPHADDNTADDIASALSRHGSGCLGIARGDLDGDGKGDFVIALSARDGSGAAMVVAALRRGAGWRVERLEAWPDGRGRLFVDVLPAGRFSRTRALAGERLEPGEVPALRCPHAVAVVGAVESSAAVHCRRGAAWRFVRMSD
jgi:hypothetical protein